MTYDTEATFETDVLVIGAGMAGLTTAARAAELGQSVLVVEKAPDFGGSAVLSGGGLWTLAEPGLARQIDPQCNEALCETLQGGFTEAVDWAERLGAQLLPWVRIDAVQGFPAICRPIDILGYLRLCMATITDAGGWVITDSTVERLLVDGGRVCGAMVDGADGRVRVLARKVVLATGGYQANAALCDELIGPFARGLVLRSNPFSDGGGMRLARGCGAEPAPWTDRFYGHLVASPPPDPFLPADFLRFAQIASPRTILLDRAGRRFVDESRNYYGNASAVSRQDGRTALLVCDDAVRQYDMTAYAATESIDRFGEAARAGMRVVRADTIEALGAGAANLGYHGVEAAIAAYNRELAGEPLAMQPPRAANRQPLAMAPFWAMEVTPAITFPFRGLATDPDGRVLDGTGQAIPGLHAVGADASFYRSTYFGGLALGLVFGQRVAAAALA